MIKRIFCLIIAVQAVGLFCIGCSAKPAAGDPDEPRKTSYTQAEIDELKADGVSESELSNMGVKVKD